MSISVLCPSRNNPEALSMAAISCFDNARGSDTEFVAVVDHDDPQLLTYISASRSGWWKILIVPEGESGNMNLALNYAAADAALTERIIGFVGDDHRFRTPGWDLLVEEALDLGGLAYGDDLAQHQALPTAVFISSGIVKALGWFGLPGARHLYLDNTWRTLGEGAGCLYYLPNVVIEHLHPAHNKAVPWDENHRRVNTGEMYQHDSLVYAAWLESQAARDIETVRLALKP
jgi:hypothetical protein